MSEEAKRTRAGQFAKGSSGNAAGARTRKRKELLTREDFHRRILEIGAILTETTIPGGSRPLTVLDANFFSLAFGKGNRLSAKDFIDLTRSATSFFEYLERFPPKKKEIDGAGNASRP